MSDAAPTAVSAPALAEAVARALPAGSPRQLAVLFTAPAQRPQVEALYAFEAELRRIVGAESHEAAHARLQWWRGEIDRLQGGRPAHPLACALLPLRESLPRLGEMLHEALAGADLDLARFTYRDWRELEAYCFRSAGSLQTLIAAGLAAPRPASDAEQSFARSLGSALRQCEMLVQLRTDRSRGRLYLPLAVLEAASLDPAGFSDDNPRLGPVMTEWPARLAQALADLPAMLPAVEERRTQRHGLVLAAVLGHGLDGRSTGSVARPDAAPLRSLWTAWRTALRYR
jgi:phytoene synthase